MRRHPVSGATLAGGAAFALLATWLRATERALLAAHAWRAAWTLAAAALALFVLPPRWRGLVGGAFAGGAAWALLAPAVRLPWPDSALGFALNVAMLATSPLDATHAPPAGVMLVAGGALLGLTVSWLGRRPPRRAR